MVEVSKTEEKQEKKIIRVGIGEVTCIKDEIVTLDYIATDSEGDLVCESPNSKPSTFHFGKDMCLPQIAKCLLTMLLGETCELKVNPGELTKEDAIYWSLPVDIHTRSFTYTLKLLDFHPHRPKIAEMNIDLKFTISLSYKTQGNSFHKVGYNDLAIYHYKQGLLIYEKWAERDMNDEAKSLKTTLQVNLCIVNNNTQKWGDTIRLASEVLERNDGNVKARFLRGKAYLMNGILLEANTDLKLAEKLAPDDKAIKMLLQQTDAQILKRDKKQAKTFKTAFAQGLYDEKTIPRYTEFYVPDYLPTNPKTFIIFEQESSKIRVTIIIELFMQKTPKTAMNFLEMCKGKHTPRGLLTYKNTKVTRIIKDNFLQAGDINDSIYGKKFDDENFLVPHKCKGIVSMAHIGANTNCSEFFVLFARMPHIDGKHVAFGRVIRGLENLLQYEGVDVGQKFMPNNVIKIVDCGEYLEELVPELDAYREVMMPPDK